MSKKHRQEPEYNPYLKQAILEVIENQLKADDPPETRITFQRLLSEGFSEEDAKIYIGQAVFLEIYCIHKDKKEFNLKRYVRNLLALPGEPRE
jgi:hypothetical protein